MYQKPFIPESFVDFLFNKNCLCVHHIFLVSFVFKLFYLKLFHCESIKTLNNSFTELYRKRTPQCA